MIKVAHRPIVALVLLVGLSFAAPAAANGQFMDLELRVNSKLSANTERPLHFGTLMPNSGRAEITLGSVNMGVFSVRALESQLLLVTLDKPDELYHDNPAVEETIPLELLSRYGYSAQNYQDSYPLPKASTSIRIAPTPGPGPWSMLYIFIYGSIDIGNVPEGTYDNEIVLSVEYI